jgi:hypothetical protein
MIPPGSECCESPKTPKRLNPGLAAAVLEGKTYEIEPLSISTSLRAV